jgi:hypothetical protein
MNLPLENYPVYRVVINSEKAFSIQHSHQITKFVLHLKTKLSESPPVLVLKYQANVILARIMIWLLLMIDTILETLGTHNTIFSSNTQNSVSLY